MPVTNNAPIPRIHQFDLKHEDFGSTGLKKSTLARLAIAKRALYSSYEKEAYLIIERALEMYYFNTTVTWEGRLRTLLDLVNELEGIDHETKNQD